MKVIWSESNCQWNESTHKVSPLTQERREELKKIVKKEAENIKITLRNIRRSANTSISNLEKKRRYLRTLKGTTY